ncbi:hypothetical protein NC651_014931 [Populus alba x Populus x berolinensis]|nr:hypothetical protein NC651_014931 [Populus alba x Populus x berolinensis]
MVEGSSPAEQKGVEIKTEIISAAISTPTKRKSKKKLEAASAQASSSSETTYSNCPMFSPAMEL